MGVVGKSMRSVCACVFVTAVVRVGEGSGVARPTLHAVCQPCGAARAQVGVREVGRAARERVPRADWTHKHHPQPRASAARRPEPPLWLSAFTAVRPPCRPPPTVPPRAGLGPTGARPALPLFAYD